MKFHSTLLKLCGTLVGYTCARWSAYQMGNGQMIDCSENLCTQRKTCPSAILSTTNPTWTGLGLNLGLCGGKLVAKHQSCVTVYFKYRLLLYCNMTWEYTLVTALSDVCRRKQNSNLSCTWKETNLCLY
jgi:hypothetical protein